MGGCMGWWVGGWMGGWVETTWWMVGPGQIIKNRINLDLIEIIQFCLKIYDLLTHPHLWVGVWMVGWMGGLICGSMETTWGQHEDNVETTWGQHGDHGDVQTRWGQHGDNMETT